MKKNDVIIRPIITEKSISDASSRKFTFMVEKTADKTAIKKAIEEKFKVNVVGVFTLIIKGRTQRAGTRRKEIAKPSWKKAIVQLAKDQKIDLFDFAQGQSS